MTAPNDGDYGETLQARLPIFDCDEASKGVTE